MRTGIASPVVNLSGPRPEWEHRAGTAEIVEIARTADRLGFEFFTCSDHVAVPVGVERGERFYDALATFSYLAAVTTRLRFLPFVLVLPFYHPLELAKRYGTLDRLSHGRLTLGLGVGNLREEFELLDVPFDDRGARADDALRALRASLGRRVVSYDGPYYSFDNMVVEPHAVQPRLPLWIGGHSTRALRRAVDLGDGWAPAPMAFRGPDPERLQAMLAEVDLPDDFDVLVSSPEPLDPIREPARVQDVLGRAAEVGGTVFRLSVRHKSLAEYLAQLEAYAELVGLEVA